MTLGRTIFYVGELTDDLLRHEMVHVGQYAVYGWFGFLRRYLMAYVRGRLAGLDHRQAYLAIPFEVEARNG